MIVSTIDKDVGSSLRYTISWVKWLKAAADPDVTLTASVWRVEPAGELAIAGQGNTTTTATVRLSAGVIDKEYDVINTVTASNGDIDEATLRVRVVKE